MSRPISVSGLIQAVLLLAVLVITGCASRASGSNALSREIFDCPVRECVGFDLECRRESRDKMLTSRNWRCLAGT